MHDSIPVRSQHRPTWVVHLVLGVTMLVGIIFGARYWPQADNEGAREIAAQGAMEPAQRRIAVLPFAEVATDGRDAHLADGLAEELLSYLASHPRMHIPAATSSFRFRGSPLLYDVVARQLEVHSLLVGSLERDGATLTIRTQLIDGSSQTPMWSLDVSGDDSDIASLSERLQRGVAAKLALSNFENDELPAARPAQPRAYDLYLLGRYHWQRRDSASLQLARQLFADSIREDPTYARAHVGLADTYLAGASYSETGLDIATATAEQLLATALEIDPGLPEAHASRGLLYVMQRRYPEARETLERAISLDPVSAAPYMWLSSAHAGLGNLAPAYAALHEARVRNPLHATIYMNLTEVALRMAAFEAAEAHWRRVRELSPSHPLIVGLGLHVQISAGNLPAVRELVDEWHSSQRAVASDAQARLIYVNVGLGEMLLGDDLAARRSLDTALAGEGVIAGSRYEAMAWTAGALAARRTGEISLASDRLERAAEALRGERKPYNALIGLEAAALDALQGKEQSAITTLEHAIGSRLTDPGWLRHDPRLASLRGNTRFTALLEALETRAREQRRMVGSLLSGVQVSAAD